MPTQNVESTRSPKVEVLESSLVGGWIYQYSEGDESSPDFEGYVFYGNSGGVTNLLALEEPFDTEQAARDAAIKRFGEELLV